jgi:hypothetical protein
MKMKSDNKTVRILRLLFNLKLRYIGTMAAANMITALAKCSRFPSNNLVNFLSSALTYTYFAQYQIMGSTTGSHFRVPKMGFVSMLI